MKNICLILILSLPCIVVAQAPEEYYDGTAGLNGFALKAKLNTIISKHTRSWNYGDLPEFYKVTDRDLYYENDSSMLDIYSENPSGADPYNYYYETPSIIAGASEEGEGWNREHCFSQSFFYSNYPMYSDLNFIYPADARVNQRRSNYPVGKVGSPAFTSLNGSKVGISITPGYTLTVFEPIDEFKGDIARMLCYAAVRYEKLLPLFQTDNARCPFGDKQEEAVRAWLIPLLKQWNEQDPVSQKEIDRNNHIYEIQGNRNPFIDHPEWINLIWNDDTGVVANINSPIYVEAIKQGKHFVTLHWDMNAGDNAMGYQVFRNDTLVEVSKANQYIFTALDSNTDYTFSVKAYDRYYNYSPMSAHVSAHTLTTDTFASDLYFSKYIEGSGNNHALEITNRTGHDVDLKHYYISIRQYNAEADALYWSDNKYQMEGSLSNGKKLVIIHPEWNLPCYNTDSADFITAGTPLTFDGKLALDLRRDTFTIDRIGDPYSHEAFAQNISLYRNAASNNPSPVFISSDWSTRPLDYCDSLGNMDEQDTSTGINNVRKASFKIYPNPNRSDKIYISGDNIDDIKIARLYNSSSMLIREWKKPFVNKNYVAIKGITDGVYVLMLDNETFKIIIEH